MWEHATLEHCRVELFIPGSSYPYLHLPARAQPELGWSSTRFEELFNRAGFRPTEVPFTQVRPDPGSADAPFA